MPWVQHKQILVPADDCRRFACERHIQEFVVARIAAGRHPANDRYDLHDAAEHADELAEVLARPKFDPYVSREARREFIRMLGGVMQIVPIIRRVAVCRDPRDDKFLEVALAGEAAAIISGDKDLLVLNPWHGIPILTPAAFIVR